MKCHYIQSEQNFRSVLDRFKNEKQFIAGSLESANWSILAARHLFKEVVGKKIRILC